MAAARFPAKAPAWTAAAEARYRPGFPGRGEMSRRNARVSHGEVKVHLPPLPDSEARKAGGRAACPLPIGGHGKRAQKRAGRKG